MMSDDIPPNSQSDFYRRVVYWYLRLLLETDALAEARRVITHHEPGTHALHDAMRLYEQRNHYNS
jgi:hypothetical protein